MAEFMKEVGHQPLNHQCKYTIGTLVTDMAQYRSAVRSFERAGFGGGDCEFLYIDNSRRNSFTAYDGLNHILNHAQGEYVILCHQDILLDFDGRAELDEQLQGLGRIDPCWAIAGNAGGVGSGELAIRISDPHGVDQKTHKLPQVVSSLDENFLVIKSAARLAFSCDLSGFHFYGTDICLLADVAGYNSYVIDFHLRHLSAGNKSPSFFENEAKLAEKYGRAFRSRWVQTTCSLVYLTGNPFGILVQGTVSKLTQIAVRRANALKKRFASRAPSASPGFDKYPEGRSGE